MMNKRKRKISSSIFEIIKLLLLLEEMDAITDEQGSTTNRIKSTSSRFLSIHFGAQFKCLSNSHQLKPRKKHILIQTAKQERFIPQLLSFFLSLFKFIFAVFSLTFDFYNCLFKNHFVTILFFSCFVISFKIFARILLPLFHHPPFFFCRCCLLIKSFEITTADQTVNFGQDISRDVNAFRNSSIVQLLQQTKNFFITINKTNE